MITAIIGQKDKVSFMSRIELVATFRPTEDEWTVLTHWLNGAISPIYADEQTWTCLPLFSGPGGFIAQKLVKV